MGKNKNQDSILNPKEQQQLKKEALKVLHDEIKGELVSEVVAEVKKELDTVVKDVEESINVEFKSELVEKVSSELEEEVKNNIRKEQAKLSRKKSWKIFRLDIYILVLLVFAGFLIYKLYNAGELEFIKKQVNNVLETTTTEVTTTVKTKEMLINEYKYLVMDLDINQIDLLINEVNVDDISDQYKLAIAYHNIKDEDIQKEGIIYQIKASKMKEATNKIFKDEVKPTSFNVDGINYAYSESQDIYLAIVNPENKNNMTIKKELYDIEKNDKEIKLYAYVGAIVDNNVYNLKDLNTIIGNLTSNIDYKEKLSQIEYTFSIDGNNYYLTSIKNIK